MGEAVLWHGGEAEKSKNAFMQQSRKKYSYLVPEIIIINFFAFCNGRYNRNHSFTTVFLFNHYS
jgi:hypothetical protein